MKASDCYVEVVLHFKNGDYDWVSPIEDTDNDVWIDDGSVKVRNDWYTYSYDIVELDRVMATRVIDNKEIVTEELLYDFRK